MTGSSSCRAELQALEKHVNEHAPAGAKVTFKTLGFKAFPYSMPKDTVVNVAAAKVHTCLKLLTCSLSLLGVSL